MLATRAQFFPLRAARATQSHTVTWMTKLRAATTTSLPSVSDANGSLPWSTISTAQIAQISA